MVAAGQADAFAAMAGMHAQRRVEGTGAFQTQFAAGRQREWFPAIPVRVPVRREGLAAHTRVQQVAPAAHARAMPFEHGIGIGCRRQQVRLDPRNALLAAAAARSEEHTSELQSLMRTSYAVFCLKKKKQQQSIK